MVKNWIFLNFIIKVRGGRHSTWEKHAVSKYSHLLSPRSHWQILPTSHLLTGLKAERTQLWGLGFYLFIYCKNWAKDVNEVPLFISVHLYVKSGCSYPKKYLHSCLNVNIAYRKESKQCLLSTRWRRICKNTKSIKEKAVSILLIHVNVIESWSLALR